MKTFDRLSDCLKYLKCDGIINDLKFMKPFLLNGDGFLALKLAKTSLFFQQSRMGSATNPI